MQPPTAQVWYRWGPGENPIYFPPGGFRFLSPRRKEHVTEPYSYGNVHNSKLCSSVTRFLPQSPSVTAPSRRELMCALMRLVYTACGGLLPSSAKADATSLREGGSAHTDAAMQKQVF